MNAQATPLLRVENLSIPLPVGLDRKFAVEKISYDLHAGEILCIVGESGSGKSMTANAIMGLLPEYLTPSGGRILFRGKDLLAMRESELEHERGRSMAMVFQEPLSALNPLMKVRDQIAEVMEVHGERNAEVRDRRVLDLLEYVGLPDPANLRDAYPFRLSGGQRQRVMIAMALALEPALLIADEPTTALDVTTQAQILDLLLDVKNLRKTYRSGGGFFSKPRVVKAVNDISFTLRRGETLGVVGESGSGKSTLGRCLLKLTEVDGGQVLFRGRDVVPLSASAFRSMRRHMQMVFQDPFASLNPRQTVGRILTDGPVANGISYAEAERKARELLDLVGLESSAFDRYPQEFSGGQRQRVGIARALALDPELLVADESVSALDVSVQAQVLELLQDLQRRLNIAIIFITHDLRIAAQICDRIAVMYRGEIVESGPPEQVFDAPQHAYTQQLITAIPGLRWNPRLAVL
jgi:ABC-type glutathione transport system ATPase component